MIVFKDGENERIKWILGRRRSIFQNQEAENKQDIQPEETRTICKSTGKEKAIIMGELISVKELSENRGFCTRNHEKLMNLESWLQLIKI